MVRLVGRYSYADAAKLMKIEFPRHKYSVSQLHTQVKLAKGSSVPPRETAISNTPNLAGVALPRSIISQYSKSESGWPVTTGLEEADDYSHIDWNNQMDPTDPAQYVVRNSFTPNVLPQNRDLSTMMLDAMTEVTDSIPRIAADSWKNNMLAAAHRMFNPEPAPQRDNTQSVVNRFQEVLARYEESEKQEQAMREQKEQEERAEHDQNREKVIDALQEQVEGMEKEAAPRETVDPLGGVKEEPAADGTQEHNPAGSADAVGTVPLVSPRRGEADKLKELPTIEQKPLPQGTTGYGNGSLIGPPPQPASSQDMPTGQADASVNSQKSESQFTDSSKPPVVDFDQKTMASSVPPPPTSEGEDQQFNGASTDQSSVLRTSQPVGVKEVPVKPEVTFLKAQPNADRNLRILTTLVIVGVGIAPSISSIRE